MSAPVCGHVWGYGKALLTQTSQSSPVVRQPLSAQESYSRHSLSAYKTFGKAISQLLSVCIGSSEFGVKYSRTGPFGNSRDAKKVQATNMFDVCS